METAGVGLPKQWECEARSSGCLLPRILLGWCLGWAGTDCQGKDTGRLPCGREDRRGRCWVVPEPERGVIFPGSSWRGMKTPIEVTCSAARKRESIPDLVPGFPRGTQTQMGGQDL